MRRLRRVGLAAGFTLLAGLTASVVPFTHPSTKVPTHADAVFVLSGDHGERLARAEMLLERGVTLTLVFDGALDSARALELCEGRQSFEVICLQLDPDNTREEARAAGRLAASRGWKRVVVSTSTYHITRSAEVFRRCVDGEVIMVGGDPPFGPLRVAKAIAREWLAVAYVLTLTRGC